MSESHTVTDQTDAGAKPPATDAGSAPEPSLDDLLKEFETPAGEKPKAESKPDNTDKPASDDRVDRLLEYVERQQAEDSSKRTSADIAKAVETVKGALDDVKIPDRLIEGELHRLASKDPRFLKAFQNRDTNPKAWDAVLKAAAKDLAKDFEQMPDKSVTEDREAVRAAVRNSSTRAADPEPLDNKKLTNMSDAEFRRFKQGLS